MGFLSPNMPAGVAIQWPDPPAAPDWPTLGWYGIIAAVAATLISIGVDWWRGGSSSAAAPLQQHANGNNVQEKEARPYISKAHKNRGLLPLGFVSTAAPDWSALGWYGMITAGAAILISIGVDWWRGVSSSAAAPLRQHANGNNVQEKEAGHYSSKAHKNRGLLPLGFVSTNTLSLGHLIHVSPLVPYDYCLLLTAIFESDVLFHTRATQS